MARKIQKDGLLGVLDSTKGLDFMPENFQVVGQLGRASHVLEYFSELS